MALANAGCMVEAVCPSHHPLSKVKAVRRTYPYRGLTAVSSLEEAVLNAKPDLIIPGDDLATRHLHHLYRRHQKRNSRAATICNLIERSFGSPASFPIVYERATFMRLAQEEGVRTPKTAIIGNLDDLRKWVAEAGLPTVLKADGTSGGEGVRIVHTLGEASDAFNTLKSPPLLARAVKRALMDRDKTLLWPSLLRRRSQVSGQSFISGQEATTLVACWEGIVLAALHFGVVNKRDAAGPATVMRLMENADMSNAAEKMVRRLKLSGIHGFDFMLESTTGNASLIEINPRATQVGHLTLGPGRDLPAALTAVLTGNAIQCAPKVTERNVIALFPYEWMRDPASSFIRGEYHDVPWEEPKLVRACIQHASKPDYPRKRKIARRRLFIDRAVALPALIKPGLDESRHE
jgi:hypothetical protein